MQGTPSSRPRLSVVVPVRDSAPWVEELLESVLAQDVVGLEIVLVDNHSRDETPAILAKWAAMAPEVRVVASRAGSAGAARNDGVVAATGVYLAFADSDDIVPDGAYRAMLSSLESSGSDMVIGDHLKFSATHTWSPTRRWYPFAGRLSGAHPLEIAPLMSGRACWNRMFRRSFWDRTALRFADVASVEDIEPMTRAFVEADSIDVVPDCVYLYRDRGDESSLSLRSDAASTMRYLEQELRCAQLLLDHDDLLRRQHAEVVYDADGWAHLHRFLAGGPDSDAIQSVARATAELVRILPSPVFATAPIRRMLWSLVLGNHWSTAAGFVRGVSSGKAEEVLGAWIDAITRLHGDSASIAADLASEGLLPTLVNSAESVAEGWLAHHLPRIRGIAFRPGGSALTSAMAEAVSSGDATLVAKISRLRNLVPLVVSQAAPSAESLVISGRFPASETQMEMLIELSGTKTARVPVRLDGQHWSARIDAEVLSIGRHEVHVVVPGVRGRFPVLTARMPLPPLDGSFALQPLADRKDGWRFLVDRRARQRPGLRKLLRRTAGRRG